MADLNWDTLPEISDTTASGISWDSLPEIQEGGYSNTRPINDLQGSAGIDPESPFNPNYKDKSFWNEIYSVGNKLAESVGGLVNGGTALLRGDPSVILPMAKATSAISDPAQRAAVETELAKTAPGNALVSGLKTIGLTGEETANTGPGIVAEDVAAMLPYAAAGGVVPTVLSGLGSGTARAAGAPVWAQLLSGIAAPAAAGTAKVLAGKGESLLADLFSPTRKAQNAEIAAKELIGQVADTPDLLSRLEAAKAAELANTSYIERQTANYLPKYQTTGEVVGDRGLSTLEHSLRIENPQLNNELTAIETNRELARQAQFKKVAPEALSPEEAAGVIRKAAEENATALDKKVSELAQRSFTGKKTIPTNRIKAAITGTVNKFTNTGARTISGGLETTINNFRSLPKNVDLKTLQDYRSVLGAYANPGIGADANAKIQASIANAARSALDASVDKAIEAGALPRAEANAWREMIATRSELGSTYQQGAVGKILERGDFNKGYALPEEKVIDTLLSTRESAAATKAALTGKPEALKVARGSLLGKVWDGSFNPQTGALNPASYRKQINRYKYSAPEILTPSQIKVANLIADDMEKQILYKQKAFSASRRISQTTETRSAAETIQQVIRDSSASKLRQTAAATPIIGNFVDKVLNIVSDPKARQLLVNETLSKFVKDPKYAIELLKKPKDINPSVIEALGKEFEAVAKTAAAKASQQPQKEAPPVPYASLFTPQKKETMPIKAQPVAATVPDAIIKATMAQESRGKSDAVSPKGATGLMQIMPATAKEIAKDLGVTNYDLKDPNTSMIFGRHYLTKLLNKFDGNIELALAAYNAGPGNVTKWIARWGPDWATISGNLKKNNSFTETVNYVPSVLKRAGDIVDV